MLRKLLLNTSEVQYVEEVPMYQELSAKSVWAMVKADQKVRKYFPDFKG